jgi:GTP-binding protein HflX
MKDFITSEIKNENAVLVGLITPEQSEEKVNEYLDELAFLAETAGLVPGKRYVQRLDMPNAVTFVGTGKLQEISEYVLDEDNQVGVVIFDDELSAKQIRNIEKELKIRILDRTSLILDIFAMRAQTSHAKAQVELAQYQYLLPRLTRMWTHLERQRGGGGVIMRGPGETQLETDRRIILDRIARLKNELKDIDKQKTVQRKNRGKLVRAALVGYTNVGKSTLMNLTNCLPRSTLLYGKSPSKTFLSC